MTDKLTNYNRGRFALKYRSTECLNCEHPLDISDRYCPNCAQANSTKKVTIADFLDEFFSNIISYDSRLIRTLGAMLLKPGKITKDFVEGKRMRYTNPFRFMLSLAIIYFLMAGLSGDFSELDRLSNNDSNISFDPGNIIRFSSDNIPEENEEAMQALDSLDIPGQLSAYRRKQDSLILNAPKTYFAQIKDNSLFGRLGKKHEYFTTLLGKDSIYRFDDAIQKFDVPNTMENRISFSMAGSTLKVMRQPGSFVNSLISSLPFATFFFLPIFALFILLVYIRKKYTYTDNLIFSFHNQSLLFILLIVSFLVDAIFGTSTAWIALTVFSILLYMAMRKFYGQGHFKTILKYLFLNAVFFILAGIAGIIFILASAFTY